MRNTQKQTEDIMIDKKNNNINSRSVPILYLLSIWFFLFTRRRRGRRGRGGGRGGKRRRSEKWDGENNSRNREKGIDGFWRGQHDKMEQPAIFIDMRKRK
jgi:hypothetical protein